MQTSAAKEVARSKEATPEINDVCILRLLFVHQSCAVAAAAAETETLNVDFSFIIKKCIHITSFQQQQQYLIIWRHFSALCYSLKGKRKHARTQS